MLKTFIGIRTNYNGLNIIKLIMILYFNKNIETKIIIYLIE